MAAVTIPATNNLEIFFPHLLRLLEDVFGTLGLDSGVKLKGQSAVDLRCDPRSMAEVESGMAKTFWVDSGLLATVESLLATHLGQSGGGQGKGVGFDRFPARKGLFLKRSSSISDLKFPSGIKVPSAVTSVSAVLGQGHDLG